MCFNRFLKEKIILILIILLFFILGFSNSYAQDAASLGNSLGSQFNSVYGSSGGIKSRVIQPTMSSTPMTTLDGKQSFSAQIQCPNSQAFLQILFQPSSTGDFTAIVSQDTNLSGHFTYQLKTPLISGVCNNGFISCDAGTWNHCAYYQWTYNGSGQVGYLQVSDTTTLGSCFCNNSSCGGSFFGQFNAIANTFGAGLASFIAANSQMAISNVQSNFPTLTYYGQNAQSCTTVAGNWAGSGYTNPAQYYKNGSALIGAGEDAMAKQAGQQNVVDGKTYNSPFNLISQNEYMNQNQVTEKTCQISHSISDIKIVNWYPSAAYPANIYHYHSNWNWSCGYTIYPGSAPNGAVSYYMATYYSPTVQTVSVSFGADDWGWLYINGQPAGGTVTLKAGQNIIQAACVNSARDDYNPTGIQLFINGQCITNWRGAGQSIPWTVYPFPLPSDSYIHLSSYNSCAGQDFSKCKLKDEQVCDQNGQNCIFIYQNYQYINPKIQPMCYSGNAPDNPNVGFVFCANGSSITYQSTTRDPNILPLPPEGTLDQSNDNTDWWMIKRTYECPSPQMTIPNLQREQMVEQQGTYNSASGVATFPDVGTGGYGIQPYSGNNYQVHWSYNAPSTPCVYSCIVSTKPPRTAVIAAGVATTNNSSTGTPPDAPTIDKTYLACNQDPTTKQWTCPATGDEQIIQPCVCLDQGAQSIATMSAMVSAAQDMVCSQ